MYANASFITTQSDQNAYNANDIVTVEVFVNDLNDELDFIELDLTFDDSLFAFIDDSWIDSVGVELFGAFGDAFFGASDLIIVQGFFLDGITAALGNSFKLGELQLTALSNTSSPQLSSFVVTAQDFGGNDIEPQVAVSAPSSIALFSMLLGMLLLRQRKLAR